MRHRDPDDEPPVDEASVGGTVADRALVERPPAGIAAAEAIATSVAAAVLGWVAGRLVAMPVGVLLAAVAGANGWISGWRGIYAWRRHGTIAFVLDSVWATVPVAGALLAHVVAATTADSGYEASLSRRQNRHVYRRGAHLKPGFAFTVGNVISGAGDVDGVRRRKLITDHEDVHVWQARWFGPLYLVLYLGWALAGAMVGAVLWPRRGRTASLGSMIESCSYYLNPFEWWAYSRDGLWPPAGKVSGLGWSKPVARPLATLRRRRPRP